jgi:hypothetical protein
MGHGDPPIRHHDLNRSSIGTKPLHLFIIVRHPRVCTRAVFSP